MHYPSLARRTELGNEKYGETDAARFCFSLLSSLQMDQSLLHEAAEKGKVQSVATLVKLGANVNAQDKVSENDSTSRQRVRA